MLKCIWFVVLVTIPGLAYADVVVIMHPSQTITINQDDVTRLYMGRLGDVAGVNLVPVNLVDSHPLKSQFDEAALGRSSSQLKAYWSRLIFTGKGTPPKEVGSDSEVLALVAANPNIIGYVAADKVDDSVRVVMTF